MAELGDLIQSMMQPQMSPQQLQARNQPYVAPSAGPMNTQLQPLDEMAFRQWAGQNKVPFDVNAPSSDYDMRGFYQGLQQQNPRAVSGINPNDSQMHYPDTWKTPQHQSFSGDSKFAGPMAPRWNEQDQLVSPGARILYDERKPR